MKSISCDFVMRKYGVRPSFVKIDIQGAEPLAFVGAKELLSDGLPLKMVVEFWPDGLRMAGAEPLSLVRDLKKYGFELFSIDEQAKALKPIVDISDEKRVGKNIFCVRS